MPRQRIDVDDVVETAVSLIDREGVDALTLARVAEELGVQPSALYNHVEGLDGLRRRVAVRASENLAEALLQSAVARAGDDALRALATAYRRFAIEHPGQYAGTLMVPADADALAAARAAIVDVIARVLASSRPDDVDTVHHARIVRSAIHGFVALETTESFTRPDSTEETFTMLVDFLIRGLS